MNDATAQLVEKLATQLGTTAEHLWKVLVAQAPITASAYTATWIIMFAIGVLTLYLLYKNRQHKYGNWFVIFAVIPIMILVFCVIFFAVSVPLILAGFFNPEYWALKQIIK